MDGESVIPERVALDRSQEDKVLARFKSDFPSEFMMPLGAMVMMFTTALVTVIARWLLATGDNAMY